MSPKSIYYICGMFHIAKYFSCDFLCLIFKEWRNSDGVFASNLKNISYYFFLWF